jgi:hypothetical protein
MSNAYSTQVLPSFINHRFQRLLPSLIGNPINLQSADATALPGSFNGGRIDAKFKRRHRFLNSRRQHAVVFSLQFFFEPTGEALNFSLLAPVSGKFETDRVPWWSKLPQTPFSRNSFREAPFPFTKCSSAKRMIGG